MGRIGDDRLWPITDFTLGVARRFEARRRMDQRMLRSRRPTVVFGAPWAYGSRSSRACDMSCALGHISAGGAWQGSHELPAMHQQVIRMRNMRCTVAMRQTRQCGGCAVSAVQSGSNVPAGVHIARTHAGARASLTRQKITLRLVGARAGSISLSYRRTSGR